MRQWQRYIEKGVFEEIIPTIDTLPKQELESYARSVLERFRNPCIHHRLLDICLNSVAKYKERVLPHAWVSGAVWAAAADFDLLTRRSDSILQKRRPRDSEAVVSLCSRIAQRKS